MNPSSTERWYRGITAYQWLVLALASAGWIFDIYEGQIFNITRREMLTELLESPTEKTIQFYGDVFLGVFLLGGTVGGIGAGMLADRFGRRPLMVATILIYSVFSGLTSLAGDLWQLGALRFLVALGVGGEWSVAASLVAEEFPAKARAQASAIFHASSVLGTVMAGLAGMAVGGQWRYAYLLGILPALLVISIRLQLRVATAPTAALPTRGSLVALLAHPVWRTRALLGGLLATVGLATFWGIVIEGQKLTDTLLRELGATHDYAANEAKFAYSIVQTLGGGIGLLAFGPLAARFGRRPTFIFYLLASIVIVPITCYLPQSYAAMLAILPVYCFFTLGMHAGFAVYFPELFPTSLRATGAGFCFNSGRLIAASVLVLSAWLKSIVDVRLALTLLTWLFVPGLVAVIFLPETKGQELPEDELT